MLEGMYAAAAGMYAQQARLDSLSNDIANVNTTGYKPVRQGFHDLLYSEGGLATKGTQLGTGAEVSDMGRSQIQGALQQTGEPLDIAISGTGYFQVQEQDGSKSLTRDGHLQVDKLGRLSTDTGQLLDPKIVVPKGDDASKISIAPTGDVTSNGKKIGTIKILDVVAPDKLRPVGNTSFQVTAESGPAAQVKSGSTIVQNAVEASATDLGDTMTNMIESQRAYELASRAITTQDKVAETAIGVKR
ncbi:MAG: flagellar hook-basal body protein [Solirubrobacteraceae bacterium]|nr:flagellar hook-basal body protein [Patulibacter sp.]